MVRFSLVADELQIDNGAGVVLWSGKPQGYAVSAVLPGVRSDDCLVLLNPDAQRQGPFRNLLRVSSNGAVVWNAQLPTRESDCYTSVRWVEDSIVANSWTGYRVVIDGATGDVLNSSFTK